MLLKIFLAKRLLKSFGFLCHLSMWDSTEPVSECLSQEEVKVTEYRVRINYWRILQNHIFTNTRPDSVWFLPVGFRQGQCLHPITSKDTTRIARVHQHRNRERHTRHAWEGLAGMGVSPGHLPCHTWGVRRMRLRSLWNCKHSSFKW